MVHFKNCTMKNYLILTFFNLLSAFTCNSQNIDSNISIAGTYKYESRTNLAAEGVEADGCCGERWILKLNINSTFELDAFFDQGDHNSTNISIGNYVIHGDTLIFYSPLPVNIGKLVKVKEKLPKSKFKISFDTSQLNSGQIGQLIDSYQFYSLDRNFNKTKMNWIYTMPDKKALNINGYKNTDTVSFVFNRKEIDDYLLCLKECKYDYYGEIIPVSFGSSMLKMSDYKFNNYFVGYENVPDSIDTSLHKYFMDVSTFSLIIKVNELVSVYKHINQVGEFKYRYFKRIKNEP
jgi:hypothetical protein